MLMRTAGRVVSRDALMEQMYNRKATPFDRSIDMHISHLRKKLEQEGKPLIKTVRGVGYQWALDLTPWQAPFGRMMYLEEKAARSAWETGGATALTDFERRFRSGSDMSAILTDARGRDLLTGRDYSASLKRTHFPVSFFRPGNGVIPHRSGDGKYYFILILPA